MLVLNRVRNLSDPDAHSLIRKVMSADRITNNSENGISDQSRFKCCSCYSHTRHTETQTFFSVTYVFLRSNCLSIERCIADDESMPHAVDIALVFCLRHTQYRRLDT